MATWHDDYRDKLLLNPANNAEAYQVRIKKAVVPEGLSYWKCMGIEHLPGFLNVGKHSVFIEVLDEFNNRVPVFMGWTWEGRNQSTEPAPPIKVEKPKEEPGADIAMHGGQIVSIWVAGSTPFSQDTSDTVENLHTSHKDEPPGNTLGHHSYYVLFKRIKKGSDDPDPIPDPIPEPIPDEEEGFVETIVLRNTPRVKVSLVIRFK